MSALPGLEASAGAWAAAGLGGLLLGLANSAHCTGMCGAFAWHAASGRRPRVGFSAYGLGKLFAYVFLGTLAASLGAGLVASAAHGQALLALVAAAALIVAGVAVLRGPRRDTAGGRVGRGLSAALSRALGDLSRRDLPGGRFGLGVLSGLLPCGVVYLAVLQSAALAHPAAGLVFMAGFGLGTLPVLGATAWLGGAAWRRLGPARLRLAGGLLLLLLGGLGLARAAAGWNAEDPAAACPLCHMTASA